MNPFKLFFPSYLFDPTPGDTFLYGWTLMILFVLLFAASWKIKDFIKGSKNPKIAMELLGELPVRIREFSFIGAILVFLRAENIPYLGMRVWLVIWLGLMIAYGVWTWLNYNKKITELIAEKRTKNRTDKYLPKQKKKRKKKRK